MNAKSAKLIGLELNVREFDPLKNKEYHDPQYLKIYSTKLIHENTK